MRRVKSECEWSSQGGGSDHVLLLFLYHTLHSLPDCLIRIPVHDILLSVFTRTRTRTRTHEETHARTHTRTDSRTHTCT